MSFFDVGKKYLQDSFFIWGFSIIVALSCVFIHHFEQYEMEKYSDMVYSYYADYTGDNLNLMDKGNATKEAASTKEPEKTPKLYASYALLMDGENGRVLFNKNGDKKVPMASTTKIMTLLIALEYGKFDDIVTVSSYAASMPDVQLNIKAEEQYRLGDLVYSLMLESHNDTAVAIAEHIGGSVEGFATLMNEKAKNLGAYDTNFVTPNGLDHEQHYTTARDLAIISKYAIQNEEFMNIISKKSYTFHEQTTGRCFTVNNKNRFLDMYDGAIGIKTGFTNKAGYCFVGAARREDKTFISVVLACGWPPNKTYKWADTTSLMDYGMQNFNKKKIIESGIEFQKIQIEKGIDCESVVPYVEDELELLLMDSDKISYDVEVPKLLQAPVKKHQKVGTITVYINDEIYKVLPLYTKEGCRKLTYSYILKDILSQYFFHKSLKYR